ncbi:MAG TPA: hypothetical protein VIL52_08480 [Bacteroidota bacterium]
MDRYLVISPHTQQDCVKALKNIVFAGNVTRWDFGCKDGEHTGWVVVEAENKEQAMLAVPTLERPMARVIKIVRFTPDDIKSMHG